MFENMNSLMSGWVTITDRGTKEKPENIILVDQANAVHYENMSIALAKSLAHRPDGHIHEMHFGNGAATVSGTGTVTFLTPNVTGINADLYNRTYFKVIDDLSPLNLDPTKNFMTVKHVVSTTFSDIIMRVTLDFGEPAGQEAFDDATNMEDVYIFDELGIKTFNDTPGAGSLLTHVIFHPVQKSLNRVIDIQYTLRIQLCQINLI